MHPYLNKNINVQMVSFVIPLYMNNQKEIDGYNRNARVDNPAIKDGQSTDRHATCSFAQRKGNVEPLCWKLAAWWFGDKEDGIEIKKTTSPMAKERRWKRSSTKKNMNVTLNGN